MHLSRKRMECYLFGHLIQLATKTKFNSGKDDNLFIVRIYMVRNDLFNCSICFAREITCRIAVFS